MNKILTKLRTMSNGFNPRKYLAIEELELESSQNGMIYRLANREDIVQMLAIERDVYEGEVPWTFSHFDHEIVQSNQSFFMVAENEDGKVVAFIGLRLGQGLRINEAHITNIAVSSSVQRQGIASHMIQELVKIASHLGKEELTLEARRDNTLAQGLYRKQGFETKKILPSYYDDGGDAVLMGKSLKLAGLSDAPDEKEALDDQA
ncbi:ribosomal protein S18-alanine N-acetyltransferase [Lactococcus termiticola]|uniref:ribosomal protein S18-alanine N-acetyltransferase n=1 Tax=Lactococcus termiticola TaxID=2169526 RepID=UPI003F77775B